MTSVFIAMPGNEKTAAALARRLGGELGDATVRRFPDGESHVRIHAGVDGRHVALVCTLDRPDDKLVPLLLLAAAAREGGASSVGLVAPYLAYMRQDRRFHAGETVSARQVARWLSGAFDWLLTVDPHLHRITALSEVYAIPNRVVHAAGSIAARLGTGVDRPLLVGPTRKVRNGSRTLPSGPARRSSCCARRGMATAMSRCPYPRSNAGARTPRCSSTTSSRRRAR